MLEIRHRYDPNLSGPTAYISLQAYNSSKVYSGYAPEVVAELVTASAGTGGSISPAGSFFKVSGESQAFTITPSSGYTVSSVLVDGVSVGAVTSYTLSNITAGHTVSATFAATTTKYTISATAGTGGSISPSGSVSVASGANQAFAITANSGYKISSVVVDNVSQGAISTYTFTSVRAAHTISATFAATTTNYTISASAGTGGSISPSGSVSVASGANQTFAITANSGYKISSVLVDNVSQGAISTYTFTSVGAAHTISATFAATTTNYTISATAGSGGSISPSGSVSVASGADRTFAITANSGYKISFPVLVDNVSQGAISTYTFTGVGAAHTISATFAASTTNYTISATAGSGGSISPSGSVSVASGASQTFAITPNSSCKISSVLVDNVSQGAILTYTFTGVKAVHTISATFAATAANLIADAGPDQTVARSAT